MTIISAKEKIVAAIGTAKSTLDAKNFITKARVYFTDANFVESSEITPKTRLLFGEISIGFDGLEDGDECIFSICAELNAGETDDDTLSHDITEFESEIESFISEVESAESPIKAIEKINARQEEEARIATEEMMQQIKKMKKKLFFAFGALIIIIAAVLIGNALF